jgi:hypothetical protein
MVSQVIYNQKNPTGKAHYYCEKHKRDSEVFDLTSQVLDEY